VSEPNFCEAIGQEIERPPLFLERLRNSCRGVGERGLSCG
jgi:hypothetical protein